MALVSCCLFNLKDFFWLKLPENVSSSFYAEYKLVSGGDNKIATSLNREGNMIGNTAK